MEFTDLSALLGEDLTPENYADLWVALPDLAAAPLLGEARRLADGLGCYARAVVADEGLSAQAIALGADRVHVASDLLSFLAGAKPEFVFFPIRQNSQAAQLAQRLRAGLITDARNLSIDEATRALLGSHPVYGGEYFLDFAVTSPAKIATLDPRLLPEPYTDSSRTGEVLTADVSSCKAILQSNPSPLRDLGLVNYTPQAWRPLTKARVIVSAGRGVRDSEGFALVKQLADKLGAELAGDQSACDSGWVDEAHLVSVTGQEVAPDLYIAVGILGDTYHNAAVVGARQVIAIHPRSDAPIFKAADLAVVAEPKELLPKLLEQLA
jgi:electron transfer flavoprotein alpha subunit